MRLDIIIPHYREPWETCKYLFDSIALQRGIDFRDLKVIVVNDGDCLLDEEHFKGYPYAIEYLVKEHGGVSAARNYGLDHSDADYVMFCDIDDGFLNNYGLHLVFGAMQEGFDMLISNFVEETYDTDGNQTIIRHDNDVTFMHGKAYRREFLVEKNLRFDPAMTLHEDGYFNTVVYVTTCRDGKLKTVDTPFYLWVWNNDSTVRKDKEDFVLRTYDHVMATRIGTCRELKRRGYQEDFETAVCTTVLNTYYDCQKTAWTAPRNAKYLKMAERAFKSFWNEFGDVFKDATNLKIAEVAVATRENAVQNGMLMEQTDLKSWLKHIRDDVKA